MIAKVESACLVGLKTFPVHVEVSIAKGLPCFSIVGLPDAAVREAKERVIAAIRNSGFDFPSRRVTVNLAPAELRKEGSIFDLAMALGILMAMGLIQPPRWPRCVWLGELALDGALRPVRGVLALSKGITENRSIPLVIPAANAKEVSYLKDVEAFAFHRLTDVVQWLMLEKEAVPLSSPGLWSPPSAVLPVDMAEIKGQSIAKRVLEIAASGHHNLLMSGCPGTGKSMLAQALPSILPSWTLEESLESSPIHSLSSTVAGNGLLMQRPFRSPHHGVSAPALIGGGEWPVPGEISLAHRGVLFLDELPEFRRDALEALRQPLEEGRVRIHRTRSRAEFPAEFLLVTAMNPCPCGYRGHPVRECICVGSRASKYANKISGPLMDRIDLQIELPVLKSGELLEEKQTAETSAQVQERVIRTRAVQEKRMAAVRTKRAYNAFLRPADLARYARLDDPSRQLLRNAVERLGLSGRSFDRIRRIARTIADIDGKDEIAAQHVAEAMQYRVFDRPLTHS